MQRRPTWPQMLSSVIGLLYALLFAFLGYRDLVEDAPNGTILSAWLLLGGGIGLACVFLVALARPLVAVALAVVAYPAWGACAIIASNLNDAHHGGGPTSPLASAAWLVTLLGVPLALIATLALPGPALKPVRQ